MHGITRRSQLAFAAVAVLGWGSARAQQKGNQHG
jgi:hypothetical protein